ncbi:hypothetical protein C9I56_40210 [Paraburkholderia caribensis]|nr:hypothetical protein C9I56_40210 [Paraburkholderia caribensis]
MMPPENAPVSTLARETGITEQTLYTWRRQAKGQGLAVPGDGNPVDHRGVACLFLLPVDGGMGEFLRGTASGVVDAVVP